jgi:acyl-CoA thioesterase FadM
VTDDITERENPVNVIKLHASKNLISKQISSYCSLVESRNEEEYLRMSTSKQDIMETNFVFNRMNFQYKFEVEKEKKLNINLKSQSIRNDSGNIRYKKIRRENNEYLK